MSLKREADPFIKPDPDAKRVKTEGGDGNFSLSSIPMAPPPAAFASSTSSAVAPKIEGGDRKPLGPAPNFGGQAGNGRKRKFFGNSIKARRGDDWVSAQFHKRTMLVVFHIHCASSKKWSSVDVEQEIFERLNKARFDIQPCEDWGFLDRKLCEGVDGCRGKMRKMSTTPPYIIDIRLSVFVQNSSAKKVENSPSYFKKEEHISQPKSERFG